MLGRNTDSSLQQKGLNKYLSNSLLKYTACNANSQTLQTEFLYHYCKFMEQVIIPKSETSSFTSPP